MKRTILFFSTLLLSITAFAQNAKEGKSLPSDLEQHWGSGRGKVWNAFTHDGKSATLEFFIEEWTLESDRSRPIHPPKHAQSTTFLLNDTTRHALLGVIQMLNIGQDPKVEFKCHFYTNRTGKRFSNVRIEFTGYSDYTRMRIRDLVGTYSAAKADPKNRHASVSFTKCAMVTSTNVVGDSAKIGTAGIIKLAEATGKELVMRVDPNFATFTPVGTLVEYSSGGIVECTERPKHSVTYTIFEAEIEEVKNSRITKFKPAAGSTLPAEFQWPYTSLPKSSHKIGDTVHFMAVVLNGDPNESRLYIMAR